MLRTQSALALLAFSLVPYSKGSAQPLHPLLQRVWLSGQSNTLVQGNGAFRSPYEGPNSFRSAKSVRASQVLTLYVGSRLPRGTNVLFHLEQTSGENLSGALGLAGFPNLDTVGVPNNHPYIARFLLHRSFALGGGETEVARGPLQLFDRIAARRLDVYAGKLSLPDFFDVNAVGGDNHYQFSNWSINNNATYGYPADSRGYTYGVLLEYHQRDWTTRFAEALQSKVDNANEIDFRIARSHSEHFEQEIPLRFVRDHVGFVRAMAFMDYGPLALYRDAIDESQQTGIVPPDLARHRKLRRTYGFGLTVEQELTTTVRVYARAGWAQGKIESRNNTEADVAASSGFDLTGDRWGRYYDKLGAAVAVSSLARDHRDYLALGGIGAVLGDGRLTYRSEKLAEVYYTTRVLPGVYLTADLQGIWNPGYNHDRGPVLVASLRLHLEGILLGEPR